MVWVVGYERLLLVKVGAVVSITTICSFEYPDEPVFTPTTVARALKVCVPAEIFAGGEKEYAPVFAAVAEPRGVVLPSMYMYTVAPASATPVISGVRSFVGVAAITDGVATITGTGKNQETTSDAGPSFPRISIAVT